MFFLSVGFRKISNSSSNFLNHSKSLETAPVDVARDVLLVFHCNYVFTVSEVLHSFLKYGLRDYRRRRS